MAMKIILLLSILTVFCLGDTCVEHCSSCTNLQSCSKCQQGYFLVNNIQCQPCPQGCASCLFGTDGKLVCSSCKQGTQLNANKQCFSCIPACETCSGKPNNCTTCKSGLKPVSSANGNTCIEDTLCNSIKHCTSCLSSTTTQICATCQDRYFNFRRGCDRCQNTCKKCYIDHQLFWNQFVAPFWNQTRIDLQTKISSTTKRRLLQNNNNNNGNNNNNNNGNNGNKKNYTQTYKNWTMTDWDAAKWTMQQLIDYQNMSKQSVRGWFQAYFFFKAAQTQMKPGDNLTNLIYNCLPIFEQIKNLTYDDQDQWKHFARYLSTFSDKKWNAPKLNDAVVAQAIQMTQCTQCQPGWSISQDTGLCVKCPQDCAACNTDQTCLACASGYYLTSTKTCQPCSSSCGNCSSTPTNCTSCPSPLSLSTTTITTTTTNTTSNTTTNTTTTTTTSSCVQCTSPCQTCYADNVTKCKTCNSSYSLLASTDTGVCYKCADSKCKQCDSTDTNKCSMCHQGSVLSADKCLTCADNCLFCSLLTVSTTNTTTNTTTTTTTTPCYQCNLTYTLTSTSTCAACPTDCLLCLPTNTSICLLCKSGKYLDYKTSTCTTCKNGCNRCKSDDQCQQYKPGVVIYDGNVISCRPGCLACSASNPLMCTSCADRYYLNSDTNTCAKCTQGCLSCTSSTQCSQCISSTILKDGKCQTCDKSCATCLAQNLSACTSCRRGMILSTDNKCIQSTSLCTRRGCIACSATSTSICKTCDNGYALTSDGSCRKCLGWCTGTCNATNVVQCLSCMDGFYLNDNKCNRCQSGCSTCDSTGKCNNCVQGYTLNSSTNTCARTCLDPCATCQQTTCLSCKTGYVLQNNKCVVDISCNNVCSTCLSGSQQNPDTLACTRCLTDCATCSSGVCTACFDGYYLDTTTNKCIACSTQCYTCYGASTCKVCNVGYTKQILSDGKKYEDIVFGSRCIACNPNCKDCDIYKNRCSACKSGFRLRGQKCVGSYTCKYRARINHDYKSFLSAGKSDNFLAAFLQRTGFDTYRVIIDSISQGSTVVQATVSADSQEQANQIQQQLSSVNSLDGFQVLSSSSDVAYNDQTIQSQPETFQGSQRTAIIIGCSIGGFVLLLILGFLFYRCVYLPRKYGKNYNQREMVYSTDKPQVLQPGQGEYGYNLGHPQQSTDNNMYSIY